MIRFLDTALPRRNVLRGLAIAALLIGVIGSGLWVSRRSQASEDRPVSNHEVSQKSWVTSAEIKSRFPAEKHEAFMRRAIANSRTAGVEKGTGGAFGAVIVGHRWQHRPRALGRIDPQLRPHLARRDGGDPQRLCGLKVLKLDGCILYTSSEPCPIIAGDRLLGGPRWDRHTARASPTPRSTAGLTTPSSTSQFSNLPSARAIPPDSAPSERKRSRSGRSTRPKPATVPY